MNRGSRIRVRARARIHFVLLAIAALLISSAIGANVARAAGTGTAVAFQIDPAHDGVQVDASLKPPFGQRWHVTFPSRVSYPLIAQGLVFVTTGDNEDGARGLYALDQQTGQTVWSQPLSFVFPWSAAAYDAGRVFVLGNDPCFCGGDLSAYDAATGALLWTVRLGQSFFSSAPTAVGGVVYASGGDENLYAVDEATGLTLATARVFDGDNSSPAVSDNGVFVSYSCNQVYGFATRTLTPLWHHQTGCSGGGGATPVYANGRLFTNDFFGDLIFDAASGAVLGTHDSGATPAVLGNTLWGINNSTLFEEDVSAASPTVSWNYFAGGESQMPPLVLTSPAGTFVIEGSVGGTLSAVDAATGAWAWSWPVGSEMNPRADGYSQPPAALAAGQGLLMVPATNTLIAYQHDGTAPTINVPGTITAKAPSLSGAVVSFSVSATDPDDTATVDCSPPSGSTFPIGTTHVQCLAVDTAGNYSNATFRIAVSAPLSDCDLGDYKLSKGVLNIQNANLSGCNLPGIDLTGAAAAQVNLHAAYLDGANLSRANLGQANLTNATLTGANLLGANLGRANLTGASMTGAILTGVTWSQTTCPDGTSSTTNGGTCVGHL